MGESVLAASVAKPVAIEGRDMIILYGSETGNSEEIAMELAKMAERLHFNTVVGEMDGFKLVRFPMCVPINVLHVLIYSFFARRTCCATLWPSLSPLPRVKVICQRTQPPSGKTLDAQSSTAPTVLRLLSSPSLDLVTAPIQSKITLLTSEHSRGNDASHDIERFQDYELT